MNDLAMYTELYYIVYISVPCMMVIFNEHIFFTQNVFNIFRDSDSEDDEKSADTKKFEGALSGNKIFLLIIN